MYSSDRFMNRTYDIKGFMVLIQRVTLGLGRGGGGGKGRDVVCI